MAQKNVDNKIPIYKLKTTDEIMKYYDEWGINNKYDKDMVDWNYTGPKETVNTFDFGGGDSHKRFIRVLESSEIWKTSNQKTFRDIEFDDEKE